MCISSGMCECLTTGESFVEITPGFVMKFENIFRWRHVFDRIPNIRLKVESFLPLHLFGLPADIRFLLLIG